MGGTPRARDGRLRRLKVGDLVPSTVALGKGPRVDAEGYHGERYEGVYVVLEGYGGEVRRLCR